VVESGSSLVFDSRAVWPHFLLSCAVKIPAWFFCTCASFLCFCFSAPKDRVARAGLCPDPIFCLSSCRRQLSLYWFLSLDSHFPQCAARFCRWTPARFSCVACERAVRPLSCSPLESGVLPRATGTRFGFCCGCLRFRFLRVSQILTSLDFSPARVLHRFFASCSE
jgi:hypothetical protein